MFETDIMPGFGSDPQAVINEQINDDFDIFVGLLKGKFGTPTPRAGSGTEEEFRRDMIAGRAIIKAVRSCSISAIRMYLPHS